MDYGVTLSKIKEKFVRKPNMPVRGAVPDGTNGLESCPEWDK
jgi:hypothetical protein